MQNENKSCYYKIIMNASDIAQKKIALRALMGKGLDRVVWVHKDPDMMPEDSTSIYPAKVGKSMRPPIGTRSKEGRWWLWRPICHQCINQGNSILLWSYISCKKERIYYNKDNKSHNVWLLQVDWLKMKPIKTILEGCFYPCYTKYVLLCLSGFCLITNNSNFQWFTTIGISGWELWGPARVFLQL